MMMIDLNEANDDDDDVNVEMEIKNKMRHTSEHVSLFKSGKKKHKQGNLTCLTSSENDNESNMKDSFHLSHTHVSHHKLHESTVLFNRVLPVNTSKQAALSPALSDSKLS